MKISVFPRTDTGARVLGGIAGELQRSPQSTIGVDVPDSAPAVSGGRGHGAARWTGVADVRCREPRCPEYPDPERYLLERRPSDHLAFRSEIHFCLGAHLARMEATAVLGHLTDRVESLELAGEPTWTQNPALRGMDRLPLRFKTA